MRSASRSHPVRVAKLSGGIVESISSEMAGCEQAITLVENLIVELHQRGAAIVQEHWDFIYRMDHKVAGWEQKSRLQVRCMLDGNLIRADWCEIRWQGSMAQGSRKAIRWHIGKPRGAYQYTISKLRKLARDWEADRVEQTEIALSEIRRQAGHLVKALLYLRHARKVENFSADR